MRYAILGLIALCAIMVSVDDVQASGFGGQRAIVVDRGFNDCNRGRAVIVDRGFNNRGFSSFSNRGFGGGFSRSRSVVIDRGFNRGFGGGSRVIFGF